MTNILSLSEIETLINEFESQGGYTTSAGRLVRYTESGWSNWQWEVKGEQSIAGLGAVEVIDREGGSEGEGEHVHLVFKVTDWSGNVRYFKKDGYYSSYEGTEWDGDFSEVKPTKKTITVFE